MMLALGFVTGSAYDVKGVPSVPSLLRVVFVMNGYLTLSDAFSASIKMIM